MAALAMYCVPHESEIQQSLLEAYRAEQLHPPDTDDAHGPDERTSDNGVSTLRTRRAWSCTPDPRQRQQLPDADDTHDSDERTSDNGVSTLRTRRAWSWPFDSQQRKQLPDFGRLPVPVRAGAAPWNRTLMLACTGLMLATVLILAIALRHLNRPQPAFLRGWSKECPPDWLHGASPDLTLMGYKRRYEDVNPPWRAVHEARAAYQKCWHGDRNGRHQGNGLNVSFPALGSFSDVNRQIMARGDQAYGQLSAPGFPACTKQGELQSDQLPLLGSDCLDRCTLWGALVQYISAVDQPRSATDLRQYCPCSWWSALRDLWRTYKHLPRPRSVHPFYTDRTSSLYQESDLYSWFVWLWGNEFFWPWRTTDIDDVSDAELLELYAAGFWSNSMAGKRKFTGERVREARGVGLSREERKEIASRCGGSGLWCEEVERAKWP